MDGGWRAGNGRTSEDVDLDDKDKNDYSNGTDAYEGEDSGETDNHENIHPDCEGECKPNNGNNHENTSYIAHRDELKLD